MAQGMGLLDAKATATKALLEQVLPNDKWSKEKWQNDEMRKKVKKLVDDVCANLGAIKLDCIGQLLKGLLNQSDWQPPAERAACIKQLLDAKIEFSPWYIDEQEKARDFIEPLLALPLDESYKDRILKKPTHMMAHVQVSSAPVVSAVPGSSTAVMIRALTPNGAAAVPVPEKQEAVIEKYSSLIKQGKYTEVLKLLPNLANQDVAYVFNALLSKKDELLLASSAKIPYHLEICINGMRNSFSAVLDQRYVNGRVNYLREQKRFGEVQLLRECFPGFFTAMDKQVKSALKSSAHAKQTVSFSENNVVVPFSKYRDKLKFEPELKHEPEPEYKTARSAAGPSGSKDLPPHIQFERKVQQELRDLFQQHPATKKYANAKLEIYQTVLWAALRTLIKLGDKDVNAQQLLRELAESQGVKELRQEDFVAHYNYLIMENRPQHAAHLGSCFPEFLYRASRDERGLLSVPNKPAVTPANVRTESKEAARHEKEQSFEEELSTRPRSNSIFATPRPGRT